MSDPLVGAVIVTYNSETTVQEAIRSLRESGVERVVVVDNASSDGTRAAVRSLGATLVENQSNLGFGAACNQGREILGPVAKVLFLNPDAVISGGTLATLIAYLDSHAGCALVGPRLYRDGAPITSAGAVGTPLSEFRLVLPPRVGALLPDKRLPADFDQSGPVGYIEGACMLFDAPRFDEIGGFDPRYFLFFEEMDSARRLAQKGLDVHLCTEAHVTHVGGVSRESIPGSAHSELLRSAALYLDHWHGGLVGWAFRLIGTVHTLERLLRRKVDRATARRHMRALWQRHASTVLGAGTLSR